MKQHINIYYTKENNQAFLEKSTKHFATMQGIKKDFELLRSPVKKPYITDDLFYISKSNTPDYSFLACSLKPCSIDFQEKRDVDTDRLAKRFFLDDEILYLQDKPQDFFYQVWCAKECVIKYHSQNIEDEISQFSTLPYIFNQHKAFKFKSFKFNEAIYAGILSKKDCVIHYYLVAQDAIIKQDIKEFLI